MRKIFNIAGPCIPDEHYIIPTLKRCPEIEQLIDSKQYFVIHAARQTGKTTLLNALEHELNSHDTYAALYCSLETVQGINDPKEGIPAIARAILAQLEWHPNLDTITVPTPDFTDYNTVVRKLLSYLCKNLSKPLVIFFDEVDCLSDGTLITFLRQLRDGYVNRVRQPFPVSVALVGMRNIRDYKLQLRPESKTLGSASPFNIITESLTLRNFTLQEVEFLYAQHTEITGQQFTPEAHERAYFWTSGQPWLVNAIARESVEKLLNNDFSKPVSAQVVNQAAENILRRRDTHIDSLLERLKEERVRSVVEPVILGKDLGGLELLGDNTQYVLDLGILKLEKGALKPSNPIYAEVILRTLSFDMQMWFERRVEQTPWLLDNQIKISDLLKTFQQFWRENSGVFTSKIVNYPEAIPHLMVQAFLQRVINGGGQIVREYALGRMRLDLLVLYKENKYPIEIKLDYQVKGDPVAQLLSYMDVTGTTEGWLVIFDRSSDRSWNEKIGWDTQVHGEKTVHVVYC